MPTRQPPIETPDVAAGAGADMAALGHAVVVGGGIAGVSAAHHLLASDSFDRVLLIEAEQRLAHHTTGRSAALLIENYGSGPVRPLTTASLDFFHRPPDHLVDQPVVHRRGVLTVATKAEDHELLDSQLAEGASISHPVVEIDIAEAQALAPHMIFGPEHRVLLESHAFDIDVAAVHQAFVRGIRAGGGEIDTDRRFLAGRAAGDGWKIDTSAGSLRADVLVNAAGAWGDQVASAAGVEPVGLRPLKRTAFMVNSPFDNSSEYPCVAEAHHDWYLKPDGPQFLCSPADETPSEPCDARAEEIDIARTIDMLNQHTRLAIRSVNSHWAGLRTFAPDRSMVLGPEPSRPGFVWCVGQGGTGIQTAPGAGQLLADLVTLGAPGPSFDGAGLDLGAITPDRFRRTQ